MKVPKYSCRLHTPKPAQKVHFQLYQFDPNIGDGTDPKVYEKSRASKKTYTGGNPLGRPRKKKNKAIERILKGHKHSAEILKILISENPRDKN